MNIIQSVRGGGKTYKIIKLLKENPDNVLIVPSMIQKMRLAQQYPELEDQIIALSQKDDLLGQNINKLYIDNVDMLLERIFNYPVDTVTTN